MPQHEPRNKQDKLLDLGTGALGVATVVCAVLIPGVGAAAPWLIAGGASLFGLALKSLGRRRAAKRAEDKLP